MSGIHPKTSIGAVGLIISDLDRSLAYYQNVIGLQLFQNRAGVAKLGAGNELLLTLRENRDARPAGRPATGLYHFALLVPTRHDLALILRHLVEKEADLGAADHLVSEALYLNDPDGNGIEIYADRPRESWPMSGGRLEMATNRLNFQDLLAQIEPGDSWRGLPPGTKMGHIHLRVADIPAAKRFYIDTLGFDHMLDYGHLASFISAGGYHHHVGLNAWESAGAGPRPENAPGLDHFELKMPASAVESLQNKVTDAGLDITPVEEGFVIVDPFENKILIGRL